MNDTSFRCCRSWKVLSRNRRSRPLSLFKNVAEKPSDLRPQRLHIAVVDQYMIRKLALLVKRHLRRFSPLEIVSRPSPVERNPFKSRVEWGIYEENCVAFALQVRLEQQWRVDDARDRGGCASNRRRSKLCLSACVNEGVNQPFEACALALGGDSNLERGCGWRKDNRRDLATIDRSCGGLDRAPPPTNNLAVNLGIVKRGARELVGVADDAAQVSKYSRDARLARAN